MLRKLGPNSRPTERPTEPTFERCLTGSSQYRAGKNPWRSGRRLLHWRLSASRLSGPNLRLASRPNSLSLRLAARVSRSGSRSSTISLQLCKDGASSCRSPPASRLLPSWSLRRIGSPLQSGNPSPPTWSSSSSASATPSSPEGVSGEDEGRARGEDPRGGGGQGSTGHSGAGDGPGYPCYRVPERGAGPGPLAR